MDPVSITLGVIAMIEAVSKTLSFCLKFRATLRDSPSGLARIIDETRGLRDMFEGLQVALDDSQNLQSSSASPPIHEKTWSSISDAMTQTKAVLQDLNKELGDGSSNSTSGAVMSNNRLASAVRWHLKEPFVKNFLEQLERLKSRLNVGLSVFQSSLLLDIRSTNISWHTKVEAAHSRFDEKLDAIASQKSEKDEILIWLSGLKFRTSHNDNLELHQSGTSCWITASDEFNQWYQGGASLLWMSGPPGTGKTQLFSQLIEHILADKATKSERSVVTYAYCDFRKPESLEATQILGSIVAQLCSELDLIPECVRAAYVESKSAGHHAGPQLTLLQDAVLEMLEAYKVYILIDGLDEIPRVEQVGDILHNIVSKNAHLNAKILVTGRRTESLEQSFIDDLQLRLTDHTKEIRDDIKSYINGRFGSDRDFQRLPPDVKEHILQRLNPESNSMFRWVQCQLNAIAPLRRVNAIRRALEELPSGLEETYGRILTSVPHYMEPTMKSTLEWLCFSFTPISLDELHEALAIEVDSDHIDHEDRLCSPMDIFKLGNSLFELSSSGHVNLAHLSVRDYLLSSEYAKNRRRDFTNLTLSDSHRSLALKCLTYLLQRDLASGPAPSAEDYVKRLQDLPFLKHAASAWPYHANRVFSLASKAATDQGKVELEKMTALILELFSPSRRNNFMAWVQCLNASYIFKWDIFPRHATALYYAASFGMHMIVERLIQDPNFNPGDLDAPGSRYGGTPVHGAAYRHHASTVSILLEAGASAAKADFNGVTPLHSASANGDLVVMKLLLDRLTPGAVAAKDGVGQSPFDWALGAGQTEAADLLKTRLTSSMSLKGIVSSGQTPTSSDAIGPKQPLQTKGDNEEARRALGGDEGRISPRLGPMSEGQDTNYYFPDFYSKRSGLDSSIIVAVNPVSPSI